MGLGRERPEVDQPASGRFLVNDLRGVGGHAAPIYEFSRYALQCCCFPYRDPCGVCVGYHFGPSNAGLARLGALLGRGSLSTVCLYTASDLSAVPAVYGCPHRSVNRRTPSPRGRGAGYNRVPRWRKHNTGRARCSAPILAAMARPAGSQRYVQLTTARGRPNMPALG
jgi:hypothetical protein